MLLMGLILLLSPNSFSLIEEKVWLHFFVCFSPNYGAIYSLAAPCSPNCQPATGAAVTMVAFQLWDELVAEFDFFLNNISDEWWY